MARKSIKPAEFIRSNYLRLAVGLALCVVLVILVVILWPADNKNLSPNAKVPVDKCAQSNHLTYSCYKNELTTIVKKSGPESAVALVKQQYGKIPYVKSQCHQLTHAIGRAALDKYGNLGDTYVHGNHFCASGYFHGASEQVVTTKGADYIVKNASAICSVFANKERYLLNHYNCVHGLGHGFMEALEGELFDSLKACDSLSDSWEQSSCYSGVFMQNIMIAQSPDESVDYTSKYLRPSDPMYPCNAVDAKYKGGCYIIQTSYALPQVNYDYSKVFGFCAVVEDQFRYICYQSLGRDASGLQGYNLSKTVSTCLLGTSQEAQLNCSIGAAKDIVYNYHSDKQAYEFCAQLSSEFQSGCRTAVADYYKTFI